MAVTGSDGRHGLVNQSAWAHSRLLNIESLVASLLREADMHCPMSRITVGLNLESNPGLSVRRRHLTISEIGNRIRSSRVRTQVARIGDSGPEIRHEHAGSRRERRRHEQRRSRACSNSP